jgi:hypothetical protein
MVLNHIAAILFFSGPLFYVGQLMIVDPAGIAALPQLFARALQDFRCGLTGLPAQERLVEPEEAATSRRLRTALRLAGLALVVCGLLFDVVI